MPLVGVPRYTVTDVFHERARFVPMFWICDGLTSQCCPIELQFSSGVREVDSFGVVTLKPTWRVGGLSK